MMLVLASVALTASFTVSKTGTPCIHSPPLPGVRFHTGRALTAADVKYSFERAARGKRPWVFEKIAGAPAFIHGGAAEITGIRVSDPGTVTITLDRPFAPFPYLMAYDAASVVPREEVERLGKRFASAPVGTGAFRLGAWRRDDQVLQQPVPERKPLQLFVEGRSRVVHGVRADSATISAVPRHRNPACDSCRVAFLRGVIDSVRVRRVSESRTVLLLSGIIAFIFIPDWPEKSPT